MVDITPNLHTQLISQLLILRPVYEHTSSTGPSLGTIERVRYILVIWLLIYGAALLTIAIRNNRAY